jgi:hypothetical protein
MRRNEGWVGGVVLIVIGVALLVGQVYGDAGRFILLGIGLVLLVLYAVTRSPGALIGGGIVTGLGAGVLAASYLQGDSSGSAVLFGLGAGFLLVWLIGLLGGHEETRVWPLIPGTILVVIGAGIYAQADPRLVSIVWPVAIIAVGVIVIVAALLRRPAPQATGGTTPSAGAPAPAPGASAPDATGGSTGEGPGDGASA